MRRQQPCRQGPVMLDIGGDIGALIMTMPAELSGAEVEARPVAGAAFDSYAGGHLPHSRCWPGPVAGCSTAPCSANCRMVSTNSICARTVRPAAVRGGEVTTATWPASG